MKSLIVSLLAIGSLVFPTSVMSMDQGQLPDSLKIGTIIIIKTPKPGNRPNALTNSNAGISCTYGRGWLRLELPRGVYSSTVTLTSATYRWEGLASTDQPYTEIPELEGRYTIILRTDDSQTYSGSIEF